MSSNFRYSICNEMFEGWALDEICRFVKPLGYGGVEIAPFTLGESVDLIDASRRRELRKAMSDAGVECVGLHWLLITPKWLHITTADADVRRRSWDYFKKLIEFCHDLGGSIMVLGSPKQRASRGTTRQEATKHLKDGLAEVAPLAEKARVTICLEPLDSSQTDVVNTLAEAVALVKEINHPAIQSMFDFHNTKDEREPMDALIRKYAPYIRHVHVNEMDGRHPGSGDLDFRPALRALKEIGFKGWISLEVFDFTPGPERIARDSIQHLRKIQSQLE